MVKDEVLYKEANFIIRKINLDAEGLPHPSTTRENRCRNRINAVYDELRQSDVYKSDIDIKMELYKWIKENINIEIQYADNGRGFFNVSFVSFGFKEDSRKREDLIVIPFHLPISNLREALKNDLAKSSNAHLFKRPKAEIRKIR